MPGENQLSTKCLSSRTSLMTFDTGLLETHDAAGNSELTSPAIKLTLYKPRILTTMLYTAEPWPLSQSHTRTNSRQHITSFREGSSAALGKTKSRMKNYGSTIIYLRFEKSQRSVMHDSLRYINILTYLQRLRRLRHVLRMPEIRIPLRAVCWESRRPDQTKAGLTPSSPTYGS